MPKGRSPQGAEKQPFEPDPGNTGVGIGCTTGALAAAMPGGFFGLDRMSCLLGLLRADAPLVALRGESSLWLWFDAALWRGPIFSWFLMVPTRQG